tara:strand:- start:323 stop:823 length:501 start_codon:yes stop_codon:yes gene_type:complete
MASGVKVSFTGGKNLEKWLRNTTQMTKDTNDFLDRSAVIVQREAVRKAPVDTGNLRGSIKIRKKTLRRDIAASVNYAGAVESGARARWYPVGSMQPWARRHGFPAGNTGDFLVRRAIANPKPNAKSKVGQPYMQPAWSRFIQRDLDKELDRLSKAVGISFKKQVHD